MARSLFLNLPVQNLEASVDFFSQLGFEFNPQFTNENATCMVLSDTAFVMLLVEEFFLTFTDKSLADTSTTVEAITAISAESRDEVDELVSKAIEFGALPGRDAQDHGFMYQREFYDLDGHKWEVVWMDPGFVQ